MPVLATLPLMFNVIAERSMPFTVGARPFTCVRALL
jgi:hypothetical protein